ncbi:hypothetical protein [Brevibacillus gelatini]|uniref:hypothetical protein n=1 Tax=Brevibacillus gelatini TaxID=1655277 RepID=UPI003D8172D5
MNVIGIIQTDLNEFSVLFEQPNNGQGGNGGQNGGGQQANGGGQDFGDSGSLFLSFLDEQPSSGEGNSSNGQGQEQGQQSGPQELTVRIKGIPEGQKANFLQMYQILHDAQDSKQLEQSLTIVNTDQDEHGAGRRQGQDQRFDSGKQNK